MKSHLARYDSNISDLVPRKVQGRQLQTSGIGVICTLFFLGVLLAALLAPAVTWAVTVNTAEAGMDSIFSQGRFRRFEGEVIVDFSIDIRFNPIQTIVRTGLVDITSETELTILFGLAPANSPTVNMFFVDALDYCSSLDVNIIGCANQPGNKLVVENIGAADQAELNAHELGHNLNLPHTSPGLMTDRDVWGNTALTTEQVDIILTSPLVQGTAPGLYIDITPIRIISQLEAVPLPATLLLAASGLGFLGLYGVRNRETV